MDLMQVHNLTDVKTHLKTLRAWKEQGKIRYLGITHYHEGAYADLERLIKSEDLDFAQFNYNVVTTAAEARLLPACAEHRTAVIVNRPFEEGALFRLVKGRELPKWAQEFDCASWAQFFLKFILSHPAVTCAIPATRNPNYLLDNMGAALGRLPDASMRRRMVQHMRSL
jgi:diketogulonate reductase-like aldo/keto reductase